MVSIGGQTRPYVGDAIIQNISGKAADLAGVVSTSVPDTSGVFTGSIGSLTSGATLRSLSGIAIGLPVSGRTLWVIGYVSA